MKKSDNRRRQILFRVSKEEFQMIEAKRESLGIRNREAYLRKMALDGYCVKLDLEKIRELTKLMRAASNNLNQYARWANESGRVYEKDMEELKERFQEIYKVEKQILAELQGVN